MKKRISRVLNFFAFNLLFFALYLNFIHKDSNAQDAETKSNAASATGTTLVSNPEHYLQKAAQKNSQNNTTTNYQSDKTEALKLSFN
jgi:hypothetical protein